MLIFSISCSDKKESVENQKAAEEYLEKGIDFKVQNKFDSALVYLDLAISSAPGYKEAYDRKSEILTIQKKYNDLLELHKQMIKKIPNNQEESFAIALLSKKMGNEAEAKEYFKKSINFYTQQIQSDTVRLKEDAYFNRAISKKFITDNSYKEDLKFLNQYPRPSKPNKNAQHDFC